jgi:hypothetical protein
VVFLEAIIFLGGAQFKKLPAIAVKNNTPNQEKTQS